ncbi:SirB2 family protein [Permianibacter sp. IMCC34836]|uniref:SirB2 family protein n=1 Tax=Permianibacter fluminis TaxID=2738515 RepID=UPI001554D468|nr:SirB2 family protein [Permianibacter fluminis]NQD38293.1 SirB2 family protein [Permianibacter fluminis]
MLYTIIKHIHITTAIVSGILLFWRGGRALFGYNNSGFAYRVLPHIIDTVLLGTAIYMAYVSHQYPFVQAWLTAKVVVLFAYVFFGYMAVKKAKGFFPILMYLLLALASFVYIVGTAHYKNWLWLTWYF